MSTQFRVVPVINEGAIWYSLQRKDWFFWNQVWCFCTKERAHEALDEFRAEFNQAAESEQLATGERMQSQLSKAQLESLFDWLRRSR